MTQLLSQPKVSKSHCVISQEPFLYMQCENPVFSIHACTRHLCLFRTSSMWMASSLFRRLAIFSFVYLSKMACTSLGIFRAAMFSELEVCSRKLHLNQNPEELMFSCRGSVCVTIRGVSIALRLWFAGFRNCWSYLERDC